MAHADASALSAIVPLLRQLREITGLRETSPGVFHLRGGAFLRFHVHAQTLVADLKRASGSGFDRYPIDTPVHQRKLVDDARRRASRHDED